MKILVVGATGTIGRAVANSLESRHEVLAASRSSQHSVDLRDEASIAKLYERIGTVDAVVCAAGGNPFVPLTEAAPADFEAGFADKLGGQINLVLRGLDHVRDGGSFTLISGVLAREPIAAGVIGSTVNGALEAFVSAAATELPRGIRINAVSPSVLTESLGDYGGYFPGFESVSAAAVSRAFVKSVEGVHSGCVHRIG